MGQAYRTNVERLVQIFFYEWTCITQRYQGLHFVWHRLVNPSGPEESHTAVQG
jgi:hypothetical protein